MTINTTTARVDYLGNGVTTAFPVPFPFFGADEMQVVETNTATGGETILTRGTHYSVSGGNGAVGTITAVTAPASGRQWTLLRATVRTQLADYGSNDPFPAETHERALDRLTAMLQEVERDATRADRGIDVVTALGTTTARSLAARFGDEISARDFGADPAASDNTLALQAWLDAIAGSGVRGFGKAGYLPAGWYKTGPLFVRRACRITGGGPYASVLDLKTGASGRLLNISCAHDGNDYAPSYGDPMITLDNIHLTGNKNDFAGNPTGSAILLTNAATNFVRPNIKLINVTIDGMPYRAIEANGFTGALEAIDCWFDNCKDDILNAVSCNDWQFTNCIFGVANRDNLSLDSCGTFVFNACNFFSAVRYNQYLKACSQIFFFGCSNDRSGQHGTYYDVASLNAVSFTGCYWNLNGQAAADTYSDLYIASTAGPILSGCMLDQTYAGIPASKKTKYNIEFASTGICTITGGTLFENTVAPGLSVGACTNLLTGLSGVEMAATGNPSEGLIVTASGGYRGLTVRNGAGGNLGQIKGGTAGNESGLFQLFNAAGGIGVQLLAEPLAGIGPTLIAPSSYANNTAARVDMPAGYQYWNTTSGTYTRTT